MRRFRWAIDQTPGWFSSEYSYRMNDETKQIVVPTLTGDVIVNPGDYINVDDDGNYSVDPTIKVGLNREQRRQSKKHDDRLVVKSVTVTFDNGRSVDLDTSKVMIIDKDTKANLFDVVMQEKGDK